MARYLITKTDKNSGNLVAWRDRKFRHGVDQASWTEVPNEAVQFYYEQDAQDICDKFDNCTVMNHHEFKHRKEGDPAEV